MKASVFFDARKPLSILQQATNQSLPLSFSQQLFV